MPLTQSGKKVLERMKKTYGPEKGEEIFYRSINAGVKGSDKWHGKKEHSKKGK